MVRSSSDVGGEVGARRESTCVIGVRVAGTDFSLTV